MKVIAASTNPVKVRAVQQAFTQAFPEASITVLGHKAASGVPDQPMTDEETKLGALNRLADIRTQVPDADFWASLEGGVCPMDGSLEAFGWMAVQGGSRVSTARSASFPLPSAAVRALRQGEELGPVMDQLFAEHNTKHKGGAVGLLTNGLVSRQQLYVQPLLFALIPFLHPPLFLPEG